MADFGGTGRPAGIMLEMVVGLLGELPYRLSDGSKSKLILQWAIGHYPLTESVGTTAKGTAQLCLIFLM